MQIRTVPSGAWRAPLPQETKRVSRSTPYRKGDALDWLAFRTDERCRDCPFPAFVRRLLSTLGWTTSRIVLHPVHDDITAGQALREALREWRVSGLSPLQGAAWSVAHSCIMLRFLPEVGQSSRGHGWWSALTVTGIARFFTTCREDKCRLRLRCALRCLQPAVQAGLWRNETRGEQWSAGITYMVSALTPDASGSLGCV